MHKKSIGVLDFLPGEATVCTHPFPDRAVGRRFFWAADAYVRHKAFYVPVQPRELADLTTALEEFESWCSTVHCEDTRDPRCLPFHLFRADDGSGSLKTSDGRDRFNARYGTTTRTDDGGLGWKLNPHEYHGHGDPLHVAGCELPKGFHWDVSNADGFTLWTPEKEWRVKRYANVYPDGGIRAATA